MKKNSPAPNGETGVALITSLLLLSIITLLVLALTTRQQLDIQRNTHLAHVEQAHWYALSAENWARRVLNSDDQAVDSLNDNWAVSVAPLAIEQGLVAGSISDLQGRFNINNLLQNGKTHPLSRARFQRLLTHLAIDDAFIPALIDWLDPDSTEIAGGAEDRYYNTLQPPYRAANQLMSDISELRLVRGVNHDIYAKLLPFITALPVPTEINVNTAPAAILQTLADDNDLDVESVIRHREQQAFQTVNDLKPYLKEAGADDQSALDGLGVSSRYFLVTTDVSLGVARQRHQTLLRRDNQGTVSLTRSPVYSP